MEVSQRVGLYTAEAGTSGFFVRLTDAPGPAQRHPSATCAEGDGHPDDTEISDHLR